MRLGGVGRGTGVFLAGGRDVRRTALLFLHATRLCSSCSPRAVPIPGMLLRAAARPPPIARLCGPSSLLRTRPFSSALTPPPPRPRFVRVRTFVRWSGYLAGSTVVGVAILTSAIFLHDAFTYNTQVCVPSRWC